jgi:hypothetical protein
LREGVIYIDLLKKTFSLKNNYFELGVLIPYSFFSLVLKNEIGNDEKKE